MKEKIIIESYDSTNKVCVITYDDSNKTMIGVTTEVITRANAFKKYEVVGEIIDGVIQLYGDTSDEDDFDCSDYFQDDDDD